MNSPLQGFDTPHSCGPAASLELQVSPKAPRGWDQFVLEHPRGSVYHCSAWIRVVSETYSFVPLFFSLANRGEKEILGGMPVARVDSLLTGRRLISYPFSDTCGPLVSCETHLQSIMDAVETVRQRAKARFTEIRTLSPAVTDARPASYFLHTLDLTGTEAEIFSTFHKDSVQRRIRRARKLDIRLEKSGGEALRLFYRLHCQTRRRQGVPIQPFRFFEMLWQILPATAQPSVYLARLGHTYIAGMIVIHFGKTAYYKFGASDPEFFSSAVNQLLMWEAIRDAKQGGCTAFDFGRTSVSNPGLRAYKSRWGTKEHPLDYLQLPRAGRSRSLTETSALHRGIRRIVRCLPISVNRLAGELLYRHLA